MTNTELRALRISLGLKQPEMAAKIGVGRRTYQRWESTKEPLTPAPVWLPARLNELFD